MEMIRESLGPSLDFVQYGVALLLIPILLIVYRRFARGFYDFAVGHIWLMLILILLYAIVFAQLGIGFGLHYLFWHEDFSTRVSAAAGATLLLGLIGVIVYHLDKFPWATEAKTATWLRSEELIRERLAIGWSWLWTRVAAGTASAFRRLTKRSSVAVPATPTVGEERESHADRSPRLTKLEVSVFLMNALFDPIVLSPFQPLLEPRGVFQKQLQRFLRTCRPPFLLLLMAPAVLPAVFTGVPRVAPTGGLSGGDIPAVLDVSRNFAGYALGIAAWLLGIQIGVLAIKSLIRLSELVYAIKSAPTSPPANVAAGRPAWLAGEQSCPRAEQDCPASGCARGEPATGIHPPDQCVTRAQINWSIVVFVVFFVSVYLLMGNVEWLRRWVSPAFAICALLGIAAMGYALLAIVPRMLGFRNPKMLQVPLLLLMALWVGWSNNDPFKTQFEKLEAAYAKASQPKGASERNLRDRVDELYFLNLKKTGHDGLIPEHEALEGWAKQVRPDDRDVIDRRPKLVLVAVSGGAARSAYWSAVVLDRLERELPEFGRRVRLISGASGGMLGTACYEAYRRDVALGRVTPRQGAIDPQPTTVSRPPDWIEGNARAGIMGVPCNSIDPVAKFIALSEVWRALWPEAQAVDRGVVLERDWRDIRFPLSDLRPQERQGLVPSLIFSPMIVEDGRQLLISNLDLTSDGPDGGTNEASRQGSYGGTSPMVVSRGSQISYARNGTSGVDQHNYSLSGLEYYRLFPGAEGLLLSTAVRMSASFPYVSPAVNLPTTPPRRVVDAGYYDNYGVKISVAWIRRNFKWLTENTSGVLLVQIRDSSSVKDRLDVDDTPPGNWEKALRGFQFFTSPADALNRARYTVSSFNNNAEVQALGTIFTEAMEGKVHNPQTFFATVILENSAEVVLRPPAAGLQFWDEVEQQDAAGSHHTQRRGVTEVAMTWNLTRSERQAIQRAIPEHPREGSRYARTKARDDLRDWLYSQVFYATKADKPLPPGQGSPRTSLPPGPERELQFKRLEQYRNYERIVNLREWWKQSGRRVQPQASLLREKR